MKKSDDNNNSLAYGFTLVEVLVSFGIILALGSIMLATFVTTSRMTTKVNNLVSIRQNGNAAMTQIEKMLQYAEHFEGAGTSAGAWVTSCVGAMPTFKHIRVRSFDGGTIQVSCMQAATTIASNSASLIDATNFSVPFATCSFSCTQPDLDTPPTIGISFIIQKRIANTFLEDPTPLPFTTSVTIRNKRL